MRVVIAGGTGFLGSALVARFRAEGRDVVVLTRRPGASHELGWSPQDTSRPHAWVQAIDGAGAVINLAGASIAGGRWTRARKRAIRDSRVEATRALAAAIRAARQPPSVFVSSSAVGIYGDRGSEILTEASSTGPGFLGDVGRAWEAEAMAAAVATRVVLPRSGVVLSRTEGALPQLARPFWFFAGGPVGSGRQYLSWIHLDDWLALIQWLVASGAVSGPVNATAPHPVTNAEFAHTLGRVIGRPSWLPVPALPVRLLLGEMAQALIVDGQRAVPEKAEALGFGFRHPRLDGALAAIYR